MPTFLHSKSSDNKKAANKLLASGLYAPAIHSAYYACILLMLDIMVTEYEKTDIEVEQLAQSAQDVEKKGTHNWLIQEFKNKLLLKDAMVISDFNRYIVYLKDNRKKADYRNIEITERTAKQAVEVCLPLIYNILSDKFRTS